jgi:hypothetical protein
MNRPSFKRSPEDEATYAKWRRGMFIFYGSIGLVAVAIILVTHFSRAAFQLFGN